MRGLRFLAALLTLMLVAGCSTDLQPAVTDASSTTIPGLEPGHEAPGALEEPPDWLTVSLRYSRRHDFGRRISVVTANESSEEVEVSRIWLRADHFVELAPDEKTSRIRPGGTVALRASFGEVADCEASERLGVEVIMEVSVDPDEGPRLYRWSDLSPSLADGIREVECAEQLISRSVAVAVDDHWTAEDDVINATMVFERRDSDETITIADIQGMILFGAHPVEGDDPLGRLEPDAAHLEIPIRVNVLRCDEHALSQAPDGIVFRAFISVGDRPSHLIYTSVPPPLEEELWEIAARCFSAR